jgi:hypothetical protein
MKCQEARTLVRLQTRYSRSAGYMKRKIGFKILGPVAGMVALNSETVLIREFGRDCGVARRENVANL